METWQVYGFGGELLAEYSYGGAPSSPQKEYGYRSGQLVVAAESSSNVKWTVTDHLGTPRIVVALGGGLAGVTRHDYLPFGEELMVGMGNGSIRTGAGGMGYVVDAVRQKFGSKERDDETGLDYFEARYFSSKQGRFTSPDEFTGGPDELFTFVEDTSINPTFYADLTNPQSLNKYQFAYNNPLRYVDPDGHEPNASPNLEPCCTQEQIDNINAATAAGAVGGAVVGGVVGAGVGGVSGATVGAGAGTLVLPGLGTAGGAVVGAGAGGVKGAIGGAAIGTAVGATALGGGVAAYYYVKDYFFPPAPAPKPDTQTKAQPQAQPQAPPAPVAMPRPIDKPRDKGHRKGKDHNKHTKNPAGDPSKRPPGFKPRIPPRPQKPPQKNDSES